MLINEPINELEEDILIVLHKHSSRNPYSNIILKDLSEDELKVFNQDRVESILSAYLNEENPNFTRLRWLLRRLAQVGTQSAIDFCIKNINNLIPAISDVCHYLVSVTYDYKGDWKGSIPLRQ